MVATRKLGFDSSLEQIYGNGLKKIPLSVIPHWSELWRAGFEKIPSLVKSEFGGFLDPDKVPSS
jgi:hypothetical protein